MLVDLNKQGTIILSTYRSGGTLLKNVINNYLGYNKIPYQDLSELDIQLESEIKSESLDELIDNLYCNDGYVTALLNNPVTITLLQKSKYLDNIVQDYNVVYLERHDKEKCILSLALWEEFIDTGIYVDRKLWTPEAMMEFHNKLLSNPIPFNYLGLGQPYNFHSGNPDRFVNALLTVFCNQMFTLRNIASKYSLHTLYYETYEENVGVLKDKYFSDQDDKFLKVIVNLQKNKIPYVSENYLDYYDDITKRVFKNWNINEL